MKKVFMAMSLGAALLLSQSAFADGRHYNRGYSGWGYNSGYRNSYNRYGSRYSSRFGSRYYSPNRYRRGGNYFNISYGNYYPNYGYGRYGRYNRYDAGDIVGGIVLGSILSSGIRSYRDSYRPREVERVVYRSQPNTRTTEVVRVNRNSAPIASGRKLLRDLQGNCYEIGTNELGDEVRTELDPANCSY